MYEPAQDDEITGLSNYLDQQLTAIRAAVVGLTDEQARMRPCRSALSIGGLVKHATYVMHGATRRLTGDDTLREINPDAYAAHEGSLSLRDDERAADAVTEFDATRPAYLAAVAAADPSAATVESPAPWFGIFDARPASLRYYLVHQIEEMARHAGHADIIREQIDGISVPAIVLTDAGMQQSQFFEPYVAAPGTIGAT